MNFPHESLHSAKMKHTKIIATVGPACDSFEKLKILANCGVNIFRLNFSHGTHESHGNIIKLIRRLNKKRPENVAILLDTKGPEIRTGDVSAPIIVKAGQTLTLTTDFVDPDKAIDRVGVNYDEFINDVEVGEKILIDNGIINLEILEKKGTDVICKVLDDGEITSRRHLNLPGKNISLESITEKDWKDIKFGVKLGVDFIALSFVRRADEIKEIKKFLKKEKCKAKVIAKIENLEATKHLGTIIDASDGAMVARGDLGAEIPFEQVPRIQREIVSICGEFQKPVIVATHMLESMIHNPIPTRAEVTDISEAVWQRSDCIMLSGETAAGEYPEKSVRAMVAIATETEKNCLPNRSYRSKVETLTSGDAFCKMAAQMAQELDYISAIVVITRSGLMAQHMSSFRPRVPIFAFTNESSARRQLQMSWGVTPFRIDFSETPQVTIQRARERLVDSLPEWKGKSYVLVSDFLVEGEFVPTLQIRDF